MTLQFYMGIEHYEKKIWLHENNKDPSRAFVKHSLESILATCKLATWEISIFHLLSVPEQAVLGLTWLQTRKTRPIWASLLENLHSVWFGFDSLRPSQQIWSCRDGQFT